MNTAASPWAALSASLNLGETDTVSQAKLDAIIWASVYCADSVAPPAGPNADGEE